MQQKYGLGLKRRCVKRIKDICLLDGLLIRFYKLVKRGTFYRYYYHYYYYFILDYTYTQNIVTYTIEHFSFFRSTAYFDQYVSLVSTVSARFVSIISETKLIKSTS